MRREKNTMHTSHTASRMKRTWDWRHTTLGPTQHLTRGSSKMRNVGHILARYLFIKNLLSQA